MSNDPTELPKPGSWCTVQIKRNLLGASGGALVPPVSDRNDTCVTGRLVRATEKWVVLAIPDQNEATAEFWVPMDTVLLLEIRR